MPVKSFSNHSAAESPPAGRNWGFLTNHTRVLLCIVRGPGVRLRDISLATGLAERAVHRIVSELVEAGYLTRHRLGRRSFYEVHREVPLRDEASGVAVGELIAAIAPRSGGGEAGPEAERGPPQRPSRGWRR